MCYSILKGILNMDNEIIKKGELLATTPIDETNRLKRTEPDKNVHYFQNEWEFTWA